MATQGPGGWSLAERDESWARWGHGELLRTIARHLNTHKRYRYRSRRPSSEA